MRPLKAVLFGLIVCSLGLMWLNRSAVFDAYSTTGPSAPDVRLSGVDLAVGLTPMGASPLARPLAPDGRGQPAPALLPMAAAEEPTVAMGGGTASLRGTVVGPDGPVAGATVEIQRHTEAGIGSRLLTTSEEGEWSVRGMPGGRYRVRAWLPALLTMGGSEVRFVEAGEVADFTFSLWGIDPSPGLELVDAGPIYEGSTGEVAVVASRRSIDADGFIVTTPLPGVGIDVEVTPDVVLLSSSSGTAGVDGAARFTIGCPAPGVVFTPTGEPDADADTGTDPATDSGPDGTDGGTEPITGTSDGGPSDDATIEGTTLLGVDTMVARSGLMVATFRLPGCQPVPEPAPTGDGAAGDG